MKFTRLLALSMILAVALVSSADARPRPRGFSGKKFEANKTFGLGLELGAPTGITGKYFVAPSGALDFGLGAVYGHYYGDDGLHLYMDYLWHPLVLASPEPFELPFYIGVGGRFWTFDYCRANNDCGVDGSVFGIRVPIGLDFDFNNVPLDVFVQLTPTLDFYRGYRYRDHDVWLDFDFSVGIRYWFN
jgi:hypothetical protein